MKKILMGLLLSCSLFSLVPVEADITDILLKEVKARSFTPEKGKKTTETNLIQFVTADDGSIIHLGIWVDCIIGTIVGNSPAIGQQIILLPTGEILDQSTDYSKKKDYFVNKYSWGKVTSWNHKQVVTRK